MSQSLKILLLGDASNYHRTLAEGLRRLGHDVTVASDGSRWMNTERDIDLSRPLHGKAGGALLWMKINRLFASGRLTGYDIVSLNSTTFASLRPERLDSIFTRIREGNKRVFISALGTDSRYVDVCLGTDSPLRYNEFRVGSTPTEYALENAETIEEWQAEGLSRLCDRIYRETDGAVAALYEYYAVCSQFLPSDKIAYGGIPIDTKAIEFCPRTINQGEKVRLFLGRHKGRLTEKGTDQLEKGARIAVERHSERLTLDIVENVPYDEYLQRLRSADIVLDQVYSYTPATNALLAMAMGKVTVSGAEPEFYNFIGETSLRPIINATPCNPEAVAESIEAVALSPERLREMGRESREFVVRHNDVDVVARRFLDFWTSKL